jgi:hypothetical protein
MSILDINSEGGGPLIAGQIRLSNSENPRATHVSHAGAGGFVELPTIAYRNAIPIEGNMQLDGYSSGRRKLGMIVYVIDEKKYYQLRPKSSGTEITLAQWDAADPAQQMVWLDPTQTREDIDFNSIEGSGNADDAWVEVFKPLTITNNVNNNILTATGNDTTINGEGNLTFDGSVLNVTGRVNATSFFQQSSRALKTNITPFESSATDLLNKVNVVEFNYLSDLENKHIGFIAEDTPTELSTINQNVMDTNSTIGVLIKAVQELTDKVKELESKLK